ncbi:MAG: hypothetical protein ACP5ML_02140 [Fervidicoccus sp.]
MGTELLIFALILSLFIGIVAEIVLEPAIASAEASTIVSIAATSSWNEFAGAEISIIELIPFILSFFGTLSFVGSVMRLIKETF